MKKNINACLALMVIVAIGYSSALYAQGLYKINSSQDMNMKLSGTSTLHKWTMNAQTFTGDAQFMLKPGNTMQLVSLKSLSFVLAVSNLKSDETSLDKNAYKALKTDQYKNISYKLASAIVSSVKDTRYLLKTTGNLTIAGVTKPVAMDVYCTINKDASISCTGSDKLKMTDYDVKPPTFMLGAMKTGDEVTLDFTIAYKKQGANQTKNSTTPKSTNTK